jgi:hypothetical protein
MYVGGITEQQGRSVAQRRAFFYGGCIWMRLLVALLALFLSYHAPREVALFLAVCGALAMTGNLLRIGQYGIDAVWWNRGAHALFGLAIFAFGLLTYFNITPWFLPGLILLINVLYGYVDSLLKNPFKTA